MLLVQNNEHMPEKLDFLTPTTLKVMEFFFANSMKEFHEREIVRNAKISKGSANKILRHLAGLSLLQRDKRGRMVFYKLNRADPIIKHLKILNNLWMLRGFVERAREGVKRIILFGSCAEGTDVKESDIDVFILTGEKKPVKEAVSRFNQRNERKISPIILGADEFTKMKREDKPLYERIDRGIVLWEAA
jgi:predicted nucleotidyltransferase